MPAFDQLQPFSFASVAFPYSSYSIAGGLRDKVHEYPHSPGGAAEKLGRKLYEVDVEADFIAGAIMPRYRALWPDGLNALRTLWEQQLTADLHVPTVGTFRAYCVDWKESAKNTKRNGVTVSMKFREDQNQAFLLNSVLFLDQSTLNTALEDFTVTIEENPVTTDLFDGIVQTANAILSVKDQIDLYGALVASKITTLALLCDQADRQVNELDTLEFQNVRDALHELWLSATQLQQDLAAKSVKLKQYTTPMVMTINAVARAVGVENPADIMQLNALADPLAIAANTTLRYYQEAA